MTGNTVIDALRIEVATQASDAALRARIDEELSLLLGADWAQVPMVLITGHRRENFGDGIEQICQAIATLAEALPGPPFRLPGSPQPQRADARQPAAGQPVERPAHRTSGLPQLRALMARCRLVLTDSGGVQEEAPSLGKPVLVMRDTTERPEGVAAGTALLTGPNAPPSSSTPRGCSRTRLPIAPWPPPGIPTGTATPPSGSWSGSGGTSRRRGRPQKPSLGGKQTE